MRYGRHSGSRRSPRKLRGVIRTDDVEAERREQRVRQTRAERRAKAIARANREAAARETVRSYEESGEFDVERRAVEIRQMTVRVLRQEAKGAKIPGYSRMKRDALVAALTDRLGS